ncbi:MAG: hypothetical protein M2R45_01430 [Verrucomicrobia subdivision 3 bacterium]|nr:hypothetical protein [Limisphaerales bacterium]MCS1417624.1 hypothetical protein [Limisphaerales bacterium]
MISDRERELESLPAQFLGPVRGIFFEIVIRNLYNCEVFKFDLEVEKNTQLLNLFSDAMRDASEAVRRQPIVRPRPNEVGNDMEPFVIKALRARGLSAHAPKTKSGRGKSTGYPDIIMQVEIGSIFLEIKTYNKNTVSTAQRSFYLSPSDDPKMHTNGYHLATGFEMEKSGNNYWPVAFKIVDLYGLECGLKSEFNSDNRRLYEDHRILAQERSNEDSN